MKMSRRIICSTYADVNPFEELFLSNSTQPPNEHYECIVFYQTVP